MVYDELKDRLEEMLEECVDDKIKPGDIDTIKDIVESIYKLNGILMAEEYGEYGDGSMTNRSYGARRRRDSRGRYMGRYGHDSLVSGLEEKMQHMSGADQDVIRRAINLIERG